MFEPYFSAMSIAGFFALLAIALTLSVYSDERLQRTRRAKDLLDRGALSTIGNNMFQVTGVFMVATLLPPANLLTMGLVLAAGHYFARQSQRAWRDYAMARQLILKEVDAQELPMRPLERLAQATPVFPYGVAIAVAISGLIWF